MNNKTLTDQDPNQQSQNFEVFRGDQPGQTPGAENHSEAQPVTNQPEKHSESSLPNKPNETLGTP